MVLKNLSLAAMAAVLVLASSGRANPPAERPSSTPGRVGAAHTHPDLGAEYAPYPYPAFNACPCGGDHCFHPAPYYHGGKPYRRSWFKAWLRSHFAGGSMLEAYPCPCLYPAGRAYTTTPNRDAPVDRDDSARRPHISPAY